jgi:hypothetical protein
MYREYLLPVNVSSATLLIILVRESFGNRAQRRSSAIAEHAAHLSRGHPIFRAQQTERISKLQKSFSWRFLRLTLKPFEDPCPRISGPVAGANFSVVTY